MKRLPILAKVFLFLVCFSFVLSAYNSGSVVNNNLIIPFVEYAPDIDGEMDEEWTFSPVGMFVYEVAGGAGAAASQKLNHSAWFKAAYNDDGFYFFATVVDDIIYMDSTAYDYEQDCFEIYFDGDNSKGATYDGVDDVQWRWVYGATGAGTPGGGQPECPNAEGMWVETADGYTFELKIPAEDLTFTPAEGAVIGFEVQCADNDTGARDGIMKWWNQNGSSWQQPQLFGTAVLGVEEDLEDAVVGDFMVNMEYAPDIDGEMDEDWEAVPFVKVGVPEVMVDGGYKDHQAYYRTAWNTDGFYFFATVVDDIIYMDSTAYDYEQDCFEIYFDGDNSKGAAYDGVDDVQWRWVYGATGAGTPGGGQPECPNAEGMWVETASGYQFELKIPAEDLTFTPAEGAVIGFEVQCADNDTGARDAIGKWWNINGSSWQQPQLFGTVKLVSESTAPAEDTAHAGISEPATAGVDLSVPAIIASGSAVVSLSVPGTVSLYNIAGQEVKSVNAAGSVVTIDVSDLANGVYLVNLRKGNASATKKVTLLK